MLYNFNNSIVSALNFNILKTNLSKIASKEVEFYVFKNYFLKKRVVQHLLLLPAVLLVDVVKYWFFFVFNYVVCRCLKMSVNSPVCYNPTC